MNTRQKLAVAAVDVIVVVELCLSIYWSSGNPETMTVTFLKSFFLMLVPTLILARVVVKLLRAGEPEAKT